MPTLRVPTSNGQQLEIVVENGEALTLLGPNGAGKSSLMHLFFKENRANARRISAHRQTWLSSGLLQMTAANKRQTLVNVLNVDGSDNSRWMEHYQEERANIALYELVDAENVRARAIASRVDANDENGAAALALTGAPIRVISELFRQSNIPVELSIREGDEVLASKNGSAPFSVAQLSDGERNALLIAAHVLTAPETSLLLIDEPERHLHRSIIAPFLTLLIAKRNDCAFVISTHDVDLAIQNESPKILLVRGCDYNEGGVVASWDVDLVGSTPDIGDDLKTAILGSRRKVLFVEGTDQSLDLSLYSILFPGVSIHAGGGCGAVDSAVTGIRLAPNLNWVRAFGLVDNDRRAAGDIERLRGRGIFATRAHSVESIYFDPLIQRRLAARHTNVVGGDPNALLEDAKRATLEAVRPHRARLAARAVENSVVDSVRSQQPTQETIAARREVVITVDVPALLLEEERRFDAALLGGDLESLIAGYPIRETSALAEISRRLGFQNRTQYESAVRKLLMDDAGALAEVRANFADLIAAMEQ